MTPIHQIRNANTTSLGALSTKRKLGDFGAVPSGVGKKRKTVLPKNKSKSPPNVLHPKSTEQEYQEPAQAQLPVRSRESQHDDTGEEAFELTHSPTKVRLSSQELPPLFEDRVIASKSVEAKMEEKPSKGKHTRFVSQEPIPSIPHLSNGQADGQTEVITPFNDNDNQESSENEAPEAVTLAIGQELAEAQDEGTAQAIQRQVEVKEKRRKDRALRNREEAEQKKLKEQRRERKRQKMLRRLETDFPEAEELSSRVDQEEHPFILGGPLPALLPESVLAAEPEQALIELPEDPMVSRPPSKLHHFFAQHKTPRTIKRGEFAIRVLEKNSPLLSPRADKGSRNRKENLLRDDQKRKKGTSLLHGNQRRKMGVTPFLRSK